MHHDFFASQSSTPYPTDGDAPSRALVNLPKKAITELVACCDLPIAIPESPRLRQVLNIWNPILTEQLLPKSDTTMMRWLIEAFTENLAAVKKQLHGAISKIHLSADLWTSPNQKGLLAVVTHFVDRDYQLRTRLIALRILNGRHTGENIQHHLHQVITDFDLRDSLGWLTFDNDETDDKATRLLFRPLFSLGHNEADGMRNERRCRCWGYIINLIVKALLAGDVIANA